MIGGILKRRQISIESLIDGRSQTPMVIIFLLPEIWKGVKAKIILKKSDGFCKVIDLRADIPVVHQNIGQGYRWISSSMRNFSRCFTKRSATWINRFSKKYMLSRLKNIFWWDSQGNDSSSWRRRVDFPVPLGPLMIFSRWSNGTLSNRYLLNLTPPWPTWPGCGVDRRGKKA